MKRIFPLLLISAFIVVFLLFTGCSGGEQAKEPSVKESMELNYDEIAEASESAADFQSISDFLTQWAGKNDVTVKSGNDKYIVLSKAASAGYESAEDFTFHCGICLDTPEDRTEDLQSAAAVMTALSRAENHGEVTGIFTLEKEGQPLGASALGSQYLKTDNFISVDYGSTAVINSVAASSDILASKELTTRSPQYTKAYKISFEGTPYKSPYKYQGAYPNGIKTIGDLLASCQSSSVLFELSSFKGGSSSALYPQKAEAVIVLQENDVESFTTRFEKSYEKVEESYQDLEESFQYTMTEAELPGSVISGEDTAHIVSLMYTMINGTYLRSDDKEVAASSNIGKVSTKKQMFRMEINAKSLQNTLMDEMHTVFQTTCGLCDVDYSELSTSGLWYASADTPLIRALSEGLGREPSGTLENTAASVFLKKKADLNMVIWNTQLEDAEDDLQVLLDYMASFGNQNENE